MQNITQRSFGINLILMTILNLYPPDKLTFSFKVRAYSIFLISVPPIPVFGVLYFLVEKGLTTTEFNENAFLIAEMTCQVGKFLPFITNGTRIKKCIHFFESVQFAPQQKRQKEIINKCCRTCKRNSMIFLVSIVAGIIFFASKPLLMGKGHKLPANIWLPFDSKSNPVVFGWVYVFIIFGKFFV